MKVCPVCKTQYTDDSLAFCLQDGSRLATQEDSPITVALPESETVVRNKDRDTDVASWRKSEVTHVAAPRTEKRRSRAPLVIGIVAVVFIVLFGIVSLVALLLYGSLRGPSNSSSNNAGLSNSSNSNLPFSNSSRTPTPLPSVTVPIFSNTNMVPASTPTPVANTPTNDPETDRRDVTQRVYAWQSATESRNVNALMQNYAGLVDYYKRRNVAAAVIRADKQRAFSMFSSIRMTVSNMNISVDETNGRATADFDKEWVFTGNRVTSGKVRSELQFTRNGAGWFITAERDVKIYYLNR